MASSRCLGCKLFLDEPSDALLTALAELQATEFMVASYAAAEPSYRLHHALTRDVAYHSLLRGTRQRYHGRMAQFLRQQTPDVVQSQPELLAHHATEAGWVSDAIPAWLQAGRRANERAAYQEAAAHLHRGLELVVSLPHGAERQQHELALQTSLGLAFLGWKGFTAPESQSAYTRAYELCQDVDDAAELLPILYGLWRFAAVQGPCRHLLQIAERLCTVAQGLPGTQSVPQGIERLGLARSFLGEFAVARELFERRLRVPEDQDPFLSSTDIRDSRTFTMGYLAPLLWVQGYPQQAMTMSQHLLARAQSLSHPLTTAFANLYAAHLYMLLQLGPKAKTYADLTLQMAQEFSFSSLIPLGLFCQGWAMVYTDAIHPGIEQMQRALNLWKQMGIDRWRPLMMGLLVQAHLHHGTADQGLQLVQEGLELVHGTEERYALAELNRLEGEAWLATCDGRAQDERAEACFHQALEVAREQGAKLFELKASMSLSRLWHRQGQMAQARQLLTESYDQFTEGFEFPDLQAAKKLLEAYA